MNFKNKEEKIRKNLLLRFKEGVRVYLFKDVLTKYIKNHTSVFKEIRGRFELLCQFQPT